MRAWQVHEPGGPDALELAEVPDPVPSTGQVHIRIKAFGLNRAEAVTRAGGSGDAVRFPRIIGIECVGTVIDAPGTDLTPGQTVAAVMGGMGRDYDGSYAEQTVAPRNAVLPLDTSLAWNELAAIPETFLTAWGCLHDALDITRDIAPRIVMRPGASALGRAVTQIVNHARGSVIGITRSPSKADNLRDAGMCEVLVSPGPVADQLRTIWPDGATGVIDTVTSSATIADDLDMRAKGGRVCVAGSLAASSGDSDGPGRSVAAALIRPSAKRYSSETITAATHTATLQTIVDHVAAGHYQSGIDTIIGFHQLASAHERIDANAYAGKVVVTVDS